MTQSLPITAVTAFVDWNSQIHATPTPKNIGEVNLAQKVLDHVGRIIGRALNSYSSPARFDVTLRIYHGWHRGFEVTPRKRALVQTAAGADFAGISAKANVVIRREIQFGDHLLSGRQVRLHSRLGCHLPNTYRPAILDPTKMEEKMVDTAIASDVVDLAHRDPYRWIVIVGDDDDLIPPLYAAEGVRGTTRGKVLIIRTRPDTPFFKISDIRYRP